MKLGNSRWQMDRGRLSVAIIPLLNRTNNDSPISKFRGCSKLKFTAVLVSIVFGLALTNDNVLGQGPPQYELTYLPEPSMLYDINSAGVAVGLVSALPDDPPSGGGRAVLFEPSVGLLDLNTLPGATWEDLDTNEQWSGIDSPWIAMWARSINDQDQIVGRAVSFLAPTRAFVLHDPLGPSPKFELLPRAGNTANFGEAINELGVIVASVNGGDTPGIAVFDPSKNPPYSSPVLLPITAEPRQINSAGVIVTRSHTGGAWNSGYLIDPRGSLDYSQAQVTFSPRDQFYGINEWGMICGLRDAITTGPPKDRSPGGVFRFQFPGIPTSNDLIAPPSVLNFFPSINNHGDVAYAYGGRGWLLFDDEKFNLDNLIRFDSPAAQAFWMSQTIQPRGINDSGQIIAQVFTLGGSSQAALLTPIPPDPNAPLVYNSTDTPLNIPDNNPTGITSTINVSENATISNVILNLKITHQRPSDLTVWLYHPTLPSSTRVQLTNFNGDNPFTLFNNQSSAGNWKVQVIDSVKQRTGKLDTWRLTIERQ